MNKKPQAGIDGDQWARCVAQNGWLWNAASPAAATLVLAHGAGAPMDSAWMNDVAARLAEQGINVLRFEFPYMAQRRLEGGKRPPNRAPQLLECWREVYAEVRRQVSGRVAIGGKSMGGRMASLLADELGADALVCLGYPFYAAGKPEKPRVEHLATLRTPTLIVQGERDALGNRATVEGYELSARIEVLWLTSGDHDLKPLKASGCTHDQHLTTATSAVTTFLKGDS